MRHQRGDSREVVERPLELSADHGQARPNFAIIDIGSNSVRMVIYDAIARAPLPRFNEKSFCRLAEGLDETGLLPAAGIARTLRAVRRFKAIADAMRVARVDVLATEATRRATNGADLVAAIARETGFQTRILTGQEEANYAALGVIAGFFRPVGSVGDMGGGSLEIAEALDDRVGDQRSSLRLGALPVSNILQKRGKAAKVEIDRILTAGLPKGLTSPSFFAVGGGWRALAKVYMAQIAAPLQVVHGFEAEAGRGAAQLCHPAVEDARHGIGFAARSAQQAGRDAGLFGVGDGPGDQASGTAARGLFGAWRARRLALRATADGSAVPRPAD